VRCCHWSGVRRDDAETVLVKWRATPDLSEGLPKSTLIKVSGIPNVQTVHRTVSKRAAPCNTLAWCGTGQKMYGNGQPTFWGLAKRRTKELTALKGTESASIRVVLVKRRAVLVKRRAVLVKGSAVLVKRRAVLVKCVVLVKNSLVKSDLLGLGEEGGEGVDGFEGHRERLDPCGSSQTRCHTSQKTCDTGQPRCRTSQTTCGTSQKTSVTGQPRCHTSQTTGGTSQTCGTGQKCRGS